MIDGATALAQISHAEEMIALVQTTDQAKHLIALATAAVAYAKSFHQDQIAEAVRLRILAERRLGELLLAAPVARGSLLNGKVPGEASGQGRAPALRSVDSNDRSKEAQTLSDLGISKDQSARAKKLAAMPLEVIEQRLAEAEKDGATSLRRVLCEANREVRTDQILADSQAGDGPESTTRYPVLLADPPWRYEHSVSTSREIENQYPTMTLDEIKALKVGDLVTADAVLYLWVTSPKLEEGLDVMRAWGFSYRSCLVWVKDRLGMGYWARQRHELLLVGVRGSFPPPAPELRPDSVIEAPRGEHSAKPVEAYELIERAFPALPKLELFCRTPRPGWDRWGHEA